VATGRKKTVSLSTSVRRASAANGQILGARQAAYLVAVESYHGQLTGKPEVETDGRGGATLIWPGEAEAGSAGTQPC
jgi:hypothetical protein